MKKFLFSSLCVVLIICTSISVVMAVESRKGTYNISAGIGGYHFECNQCFENDKESFNPIFTIGLGFGYNFTHNWAAEILFHYIDAEYKDKTVDTYLYRLNLLYHFDMMDGRLVPFLSAGIGGISFNIPDQDNNTDFLVNYGAGLNFYLTERLSLRGDISQIVTFNPICRNSIYTLGLSYLIGGAKKEPPKPLDTDGDGVIDINDQCPDTPAGVAVDTMGCPPDRDGDGFPDYLDTCPDVPGPGTVDGCPVKEVPPPPPIVRMKLNVEFDTDKADVKPQYHDEIGKLAEALKNNPTASVVLEGHTDGVGSDDHNLLLSQKRVDSVRNYLIYKFGIDGARITAKGYGETKPIADNTTEEGRQANRRVEAEIRPGSEVTQ